MTQDIIDGKLDKRRKGKQEQGTDRGNTPSDEGLQFPVVLAYATTTMLFSFRKLVVFLLTIKHMSSEGNLLIFPCATRKTPERVLARKAP